MVRSLVPRSDRFLGLSMPNWEEVMERMFGPEENWWLTPEMLPGRFSPHVDVAETEEKMEVTVELPGLQPEEVQVEVQGGRLWISGEKKEEKEEKGKTFHKVERRYGQFRRAILLPTTVEAEKVEAKFENGVLRVALPKKEEAKPRHIEVKTS